jgi:hypothetical protein
VAGWVQKHPGGKVLLTYVGEDATDSVRAFHRDEEQMKKYLSSLRIASLAPETPLVVCPPCATRFSFTGLVPDAGRPGRVQLGPGRKPLVYRPRPAQECVSDAAFHE